jgi:putative transposase
LKGAGTIANWKGIKGGILHALPEWTRLIPYQIKNLAIRDACLAVSAAKKKFIKTGEFQEVHFRRRKDRKQSIFMPKSAVSQDGLYYTISGKGLWSREPFPETASDCRLVLECGRWFLCVPEKITVQQPENQGRIVAIDPGIRSFLTFYSPDQCGHIGDGDFARLVRLAQHLDDLLSRLDPKRKTDRVSARRRYRMRKAADRMRAKFRDLVDEMHWKAVDFLVTTFDVILLPTFETAKMAVRATRKIRRKSVRSMLTLAHYRFAQRLEWKAEALGKTVIRVNEAYTSKTASWTGEIINIGGRKTITSGGVTVDRDENGARGILLRALTDRPSLFEVVHCS